MPPRKKSNAPPAPIWPDGVPVVPTIIEYKPLLEREPWRVDRFQDLVIEFDLTEELMPRFHEAAAGHARGWDFARKLFGIQPLHPPASAHPDDFKVWTRSDLCAKWGLEMAQLAAELDLVRTRWQAAKASGQSPEVDEKAEPEQMPLIGRDLLGEFGFPQKMFEIKVWDENGGEDGKGTWVVRSAEENKLEREWFLKRISEEQWTMMLTESMSAVVAREAVLNELALRRMNLMGPDAQRRKKDIYDQYQNQLSELQRMFPDRNVANKVKSRLTLAGMVLAVRDAYNGELARIDGLSTVHELDIALTGSVQAPLADYRLGQRMYLLEAIHHWSDANFRSQLRPATLRKLDIALPRLIEEARVILDEKLPDLEVGVMPGEGDDFGDFPQTETEKIAAS